MTIWIVEDSALYAEILRDYLQSAGYNVRVFNDGGNIVEKVQEGAPDLLLLDLMLPVVDGITICKKIRAFSNVAIVMLTAKVDELERLLGYDNGADDYICKPVKPREILARIKAVLRRTQRQPDEHSTASLELDEKNLMVRIDTRKVRLTSVEFRIFELLAKNPGQIYSRKEIVETIYGSDQAVSDRTVDSHMRNLRKKLLEQYSDNIPIHSVYGLGYKFDWYL